MLLRVKSYYTVLKYLISVLFSFEFSNTPTQGQIG